MVKPRVNYRGPSIAEIIIKAGFVNFRRAVRYAARYSKCSSEAGRLLSLREYMAASGLSQAQAYKEQQAFKKCFGDITLLEVVHREAIAARGWSEAEREAAILRWFDGKGV